MATIAKLFPSKSGTTLPRKKNFDDVFTEISEMLRILRILPFFKKHEIDFVGLDAEIFADRPKFSGKNKLDRRGQKYFRGTFRLIQIERKRFNPKLQIVYDIRVQKASLGLSDIFT